MLSERERREEIVSDHGRGLPRDVPRCAAREAGECVQRWRERGDRGRAREEAPCAVTCEGDAVPVAAEEVDVLVDPTQSGVAVQDAEVGRSSQPATVIREGGEAERADMVVDLDDERGRSLREDLRVQGGADAEPPWNPPPKIHTRTDGSPSRTPGRATRPQSSVGPTDAHPSPA